MDDVGFSDTREIRDYDFSKDPWWKVKARLIPFRPEGVDRRKLEANIQELESNRLTHIKRLISYIGEKGYTMNPNNTSGREEEFALEHPLKSKMIAFPKHIMTPNPDEDIRGKNLFLRRDIPTLYFLVSVAHEATHLDRYFGDNQVKKMTDEAEEKIDEGVPAIDAFGLFKYMTEQFHAEVQAFFLLKDLGIEIEPANYCTYLRSGSLLQQEAYDEIIRKLESDESEVK